MAAIKCCSVDVAADDAFIADRSAGRTFAKSYGKIVNGSVCQSDSP